MHNLRFAFVAAALATSACGVLGACGVVGGNYGFFDGRGETPSVEGRAATLRWRQQLHREYEGAYVPLERASAALHPETDRVYIGASTGTLWALTSDGGQVYSYDANGSIASRPTLDPRRDELYLATEDGVLHLLVASSGELRWRTELGGAVSERPVLSDDTVYVVTDNDIVLAIERAGGEVLWRYRREAPEGFYISRHAGLTLVDGRLYTGFTDGVAVSLDASDGRLMWERNTTVDLEPGPDGPPRFADVDTTPLVDGDVIYIASFAGGLYALERDSGSVRWREESITGVTDIVRVDERRLLLSSGDLGLLCYDRIDRTTLWRQEPTRGAPGPAVVAGDLVLVGETQGGFLTLSLITGRELGRFEAGHGFSATASVEGGRGFVLSNGGGLLAFALPNADEGVDRVRSRGGSVFVDR